MELRSEQNIISCEPLFRTMQKKGVTSYQLQKMEFNRTTYYSIKSGRSVSINAMKTSPQSYIFCHSQSLKLQAEEMRMDAKKGLGYAPNVIKIMGQSQEAKK